MTVPQRRYLLERDVPDRRDHQFAFAPKPEHLLKKLPSVVDLREKCAEVFNQGNSGTCTAHAVAGAFSYLQRLHKARPINPSRRFIFYNERAMTGQLGPKCTVHLRDALKAVATRGVCPESLWRYRDDEKLLRRKPPKHAFRAAKSRKVMSYHRILIESHPRQVFLNHLKHCLAEGYPFVFGFMTYDSFEQLKGKWKSGIMPIPNRRTDKPKGGHAVMAVGYDDVQKTFLIRNSWGPEWGLGGYFRMPYKVITDPKLAFDFWTVRGVTG